MTELNDADLPPLPLPIMRGDYSGHDMQAYARQAIKDYPAKQEVVRYEYRHLDDSGNTVTPGWSEWRPVVPRNAYTDTVLDKVREFEAYIAQGYKLEVRSLIVKE